MEWSGFFRKSHMYVYHQIGLNELINMILLYWFCTLFLIWTHISGVIDENVRKMTKMEIWKRKFMARKICHLVEHKILNTAVYFVSRYYLYISRDIDENIWKKLNIIEWIKILLHKVRHEDGRFIQNYTFHFTFRNCKLIIKQSH